MSKTTSRKWTVMLYLACDNNLSAEGIDALKELKRLYIGPDKEVTVIAQFDPFSGPDEHPTKPDGIPTLRFVLTNNEQDFTLIRDIDDTVGSGETNTGDKRILSEFLKWGIETYPADRYMVALSGHGAGVEPGFLLRDERVPLDDPEDAVRNYLMVRELREVFSGMSAAIKRKINIVGFDNCLMSMAEVAYELRENVEYLISSEGFDPNGGWPYFRMVEPLVRDPGAPLKELTALIVRNYIRYYGDFLLGGTSVDLSVLDLSKCDALVVAIKELSNALIKQLDPKPKGEIKDTLVLAHWDAQSYNGERFVDLYDFCDLLERRRPEHSIARACVKLKKVLDSMVVLSCFVGSVFQYSHGLSIYFPWAEVDDYYEFLGFSSSSNWLRFLTHYVRITRREGRAVQKGKHSDISEFHLPGFNVKLPPEDRGPIGNIKSMRNPPRDLVLSNCLRLASAVPNSDDKPKGR